MAEVLQKPSYAERRKEVKKLCRKRKRQRLAKERDRKEETEQSNLLRNPAWLKNQATLEQNRQDIEQREHEQQEELWLRRELLAQKKFREEKKREEAAEKAKELIRAQIQKEFDEQQKQIQQRLAENKRLEEEALENEQLLREKIEWFIENGGELPSELLDTADSNPGKDLCQFFVKTASCRFGDKCNRNHSRPCCSRILLLRHFFTHIRMEQPLSSEYGTDLTLEFSESELLKSYEDFFEDVTTELCRYGNLLNFQTCKNTEPHLRGNVFVEFQDERSSLRAYQSLQGRYYAGKRINVEFCKLVSWKAALCGLAISKTCPKGATCNYLHIFKNPKNKFNIRDEFSEYVTNSKHEQIYSIEPTQSSYDHISSRGNWRWSESPEPSSHIERKSRGKSTSKERYSESRRRSDSRSTSSRSSKKKRKTRSSSRNSDKLTNDRNHTNTRYHSESRTGEESRRRRRSRSRSKSRKRNDRKREKRKGHRS